MRVSSRRLAPCRAVENGQEPGPSTSVSEEEARIEALEARLRKGGKPRQIPIRLVHRVHMQTYISEHVLMCSSMLTGKGGSCRCSFSLELPDFLCMTLQWQCCGICWHMHGQ
jgi:hypothetical protein